MLCVAVRSTASTPRKPVNAGIDHLNPPLIIATMLREDGITGVHTHVRQLREYLGRLKVDARVVTPFSWNRTLTPVFGLRLAVKRFSRAAGVVWYRYWHELFLYHALRRRLAELDECVIYAQEPLAARAALRARRGQPARHPGSPFPDLTIRRVGRHEADQA